jgi:Uma2 family endonuclease
VTEPKAAHQRIVMWLAYEIMSWIRGGPDRGEVITMAARLSPYDVFVPDLMWLRPEHRPTGDAGHLEVAPDLAVEVRSPSTWHHDQGYKRQVYEARGVAELWLVDHVGGTVEVWRRSSPGITVFDEHHVLVVGDTLTTLLLPGLALDLATLFSLGTER